MPDTLTIAQRYEASNVIQRSLLTEFPPGRPGQYWLGMDHEEAVSMIGTLRGHDTLDLGDKVRDALEQTGGELSLVVHDVFRRMDPEEYDEFICHLAAAVNHQEPVDIDEALALGDPLDNELSLEQISALLGKAISFGAEPAEADASPGSVGISADGVPQFGIGAFDHYPTRAEIEERLETLFPALAQHLGDIHVRKAPATGRAGTVPDGFTAWDSSERTGNVALSGSAGHDPGDETPKPRPHRTILKMTPTGFVEIFGAERDEVLDALGVG